MSTLLRDLFNKILPPLTPEEGKKLFLEELKRENERAKKAEEWLRKNGHLPPGVP